MAPPPNDLNAPAIAFLTFSAVLLVVLMVLWYRYILWWRRKGSKIYNDPEPGPRGPVYPPPPPPPPPPPVVPGDRGNPPPGGFGGGGVDERNFGGGVPPAVPLHQPRRGSQDGSRRGQSPRGAGRRDGGDQERDHWMTNEMYRADAEELPIEERRRDEGRGERRLDSVAERPGSLARGEGTRVSFDGKSTEFGLQNDGQDRPQWESLVRPQSERHDRSEGGHRYSDSEAGRRERPDLHKAHHAYYESPRRNTRHEGAETRHVRRGNWSQRGDESTHSLVQENRYGDERQQSRRQMSPIVETMFEIGNHNGSRYRRSIAGSIDLDRRSQESREHRQRVDEPLEEFRGIWRGSGHGNRRGGLKMRSVDWLMDSVGETVHK